MPPRKYESTWATTINENGERKMRDRLIELIGDKPFTDEYQSYNSGEWAEHFADHLLAEGVIVPPCKVGDMVYRVSFVNKNIEMLKVEGFLRNLASWKAHCTQFMPSWLGNKKEHFYILFSQFGKTVFLTVKEAEKALEEEQK